MSEHQPSIYWTTRIALKPAAKDAIRVLAKQELVSAAYLIGRAIEEYVTARST